MHIIYRNTLITRCNVLNVPGAYLADSKWREAYKWLVNNPSTQCQHCNQPFEGLMPTRASCFSSSTAVVLRACVSACRETRGILTLAKTRAKRVESSESEWWWWWYSGHRIICVLPNHLAFTKWWEVKSILKKCNMFWYFR